MELLCPAGSIPAVKAALEHGADAIFIGMNNETNARHFTGLNFNDKRIAQAANLIHQKHKNLHIAINTFARPGEFKHWQYAVDKAVDIGANALIIADIATLDYASEKYPDAEIHLSVQASATNKAAIEFYQKTKAKHGGNHQRYR